MAHNDALTSESDSERPHAGSANKKYSAKKARRASSDAADLSDVVAIKSAEDPFEEPEEEDDDEEGGEEYEIEAILDAKKGHFVGGKIGYFVKWKGYGEEHNSWVDEDDAGNAKELIDDFWAKKRKNKTPVRKSVSLTKSAQKDVPDKSARKSLVNEPSPEIVEAPTKKRGRPRKSGADSDVEVVDAGEEERRAKKKSRKSEGRKAERATSPEEPVGNMKGYLQIASWEHLVDTVDTVERDIDGELIVYFTLKNSVGRKRESSALCAEKFPRKLIKFYESNLRWKTEEAETDN